MKIAFLASRNSIHTVRWVNAMADRGHEVHLISLHHDGDPLVPKVRFHPLFFPAPYGYLLNVPALRRVLRKISPDILSTHYATGYGILARLTGFHPYVLSVWGSDVLSFPRKSALHRALVVKNLESADHICSTSQAMAQTVRELAQGIPHLTVTPFGVEAEYFSPKNRSEKKHELVIGTVRNMDETYGVDILIRAFAGLREKLKREAPALAESVRLRIVGGGPRLEAYRSLARELGLERIAGFTGRVSHREVVDELRGMDVFVAVSRSESFGVGVLEASACGVPVLVSRVGGLPETVRDEVTGLIVPPEDVEAATAGLLRLVSDSALRAKLGKNGRDFVIQNYDWRKNIERMEGVFQSVAKSSPIAPAPISQRGAV
jgi:glycosyltransferase involved in cell wall biosynthesis